MSDTPTSTQPDAGEPAERAVPPLPHTGDAPVDKALAELAGLQEAPLAEQVPRYVGAHRQLQDRLADLDG